jgi:hypothetical protein
MAFQKNVLPLSSGSKSKLSNQTASSGTLPAACLACGLSLQMKVVYSFETPARLYEITKCHIPEDSIL